MRGVQKAGVSEGGFQRRSRMICWRNAKRDIEVGEELKYWYRYDFEQEQKMITGETAQPLKKKTYQLPENTKISDYFTFRLPNWQCNKCGKKTKPQKGEAKQSNVLKHILFAHALPNHAMFQTLAKTRTWT